MTGGEAAPAIREQVRRRYAAAARSVQAGCCGQDVDCGDGFGSGFYSAEEVGSSGVAAAASLGCGNPTAVAELHRGEVVLDLGSGGGLDVLLSARRVGATGKAYGLDMTEEMLELARRNQEEAGLDNVEFLQGYIEDVPLADAAVDVVISNCVINLSADKAKVFAEIFRVLRPGGRVGVSDVVAADHLDTAARAKRGSHVGCIAGALSFAEYEAGLLGAGFTEVEIVATHEVAPDMYAATVRAVKPSGGPVS